ncbi:hypothetical protein O4215_20095 [Rhodococcus maanshanensis]|uniref:hypothetical protein n=1 Tax=Rhodococcus maanshanensis TaxID=183556 RepID=UPI0022B2FE51|nr:hypothetical protein [Rhodococcus maanshanensis]MCZ4557869.1 hypothetical protein [Rhodococcus maanshanensis]
MPHTDARTNSPSSQGRSGWRTVVTLIIVLLTLLATGTLLALYYGWGPFDGMKYDRMLLIAAPALLVLVIAGVLWLIQVAVSFRSKQRRSWWLAVAPGIVVLAAVGVFAIPAAGFDEARPEMERIAHEIVATPGSIKSNIKIGKLDISRVEQMSDGTVYFIDADTSFGSTTGWIYAPNGEPVGTRPFISLTPVGGPWYEFEYGS